MMTRVLRGLVAGVQGVAAAAAELLWPRACAACGDGLLLAATGGLCAECAATLERLWPRGRVASCDRCAAPQRVAVAAAPADFVATAPLPVYRDCRDCRRLHPAVQRIQAAFSYEGALVDVLMRLKWQGRDDLAAPLGALLGPLLADALGRCDVVTAVPLHPSRLRARGYNQAALLLQAGLQAERRAYPGALAGRPAGRPVLAGLLRRTLATAPARAHGPRARQRRVAGAFAVAPRHALALRTGGLRVLLVDDVVTTGATVSACAAALQAAGATQVEVITLLRAAP